LSNSEDILRIKRLYSLLLKTQFLKYLLTQDFDSLCIYNNVDGVWKAHVQQVRDSSHALVVIPGFTGYVRDALLPFLLFLHEKDNRFFRFFVAQAIEEYVGKYGAPENFNEIVSHSKDLGIKVESIPKIKAKRPHVKEERKKEVSSNSVFIAHGRDDAAKAELALMLTRMGLAPLILRDVAGRSRTIIEKLEQETEKVGFAFVVLTPDDLGCLASKEQHLRKRARQNVILELGFLMGKLGRQNVCCLYKEEVELPSDIRGVNYIPFKNSVNECKEDIVRELQSAGYKVKDNSRSGV
jgi:predicted nucleotide-binding protein